MTARGEAWTHFLVHVGESSGDECRVWPYWRNSSTGYGLLMIERRSLYVHRMTAELWWGECPEGMEASHLCGNGHGGCWSGEHLVWETHSENMLRRSEHGTGNRGERHPMVRLSDRQVAAIRRRYAAGGVTQKALAERFGVCLPHVNRIIHGQRRSYA